MTDSNDPILQKALAGDAEACKMYCGSYSLVEKESNGELFRCKGDVPVGYIKLWRYFGRKVYDKDGFLTDEFWSLPRI